MSDATGTGRAKLSEMVSELKGVTPGPWMHGAGPVSGGLIEARGQNIAQTLSGQPRDGREITQSEALRNAAHIARCEPASILAIDADFEALEAAALDLADLAERGSDDCAAWDAAIAEVRALATEKGKAHA